MAKQNQIIAVEKGAKSKAERALTDAHQRLSKPQLISGLTRNYTSHDAEGEQLPPERHYVQTGVAQEVASILNALTEYYDVVGTKEATNCIAKADIVANGLVLKDVPVGFILFLEKQLINIATFIKQLPVLDPSERWKFDSSQDCYATEPIKQIRTRKVMRSHVMHEGNEHHPPQVTSYTDDVPVGTWTITKFSGAVTREEQSNMVARVEDLQKAVKRAREAANMTDAVRLKFGNDIVSFLFGGVKN